MRQIVLAGNWKMHKTQADASAYTRALLSHPLEPNRHIVLCVPFTTLATVGAAVAGQTQISVGAQNIHWAEQGAFTGEISGAMLTELGVRYVVVGHSERREHFGETDATVNQRLVAAQKHGLIPILCVGETKAIREASQTEAWILAQLEAGLVGIDLARLIIAYEPIWAIGTGETCEATEANRVISVIRRHLSSPDVTIQYGGSVKPDNIDELMAQPEIDGVLVGGASLDPAGFARIINYQASTVAV